MQERTQRTQPSGLEAVKEHFSFMVQYFRNPREVGSLVPSGTAVAALITRELDPVSDAPILELGPGTGSFTKAILARGVRQQDLTLVETNAEFCTILSREFPSINVHCMNAADIASSNMFGGRKVGAVVSGVPFLLLKPDEAMAILKSVFEVMAPDAALYQITYGFTPPFPRAVMRALGLTATHAGRTFRNAPPASVYKLTRSTNAQGIRH